MKRTTATFTGTRKGMTLAQADAVARVLKDYRVAEMRHGDCVGADSQAHNIASRLGVNVVIHPCNLERYRAYCYSSVIYHPIDPIKRNHVMVDLTDIVIAAPRTNKEDQRSGTWATVRYAQTLRHPVIIVWPDGSTQVHGVEASQATP